MEREKLISEVRTRLGETSVSERTIGDVVDFAPLAEGAEPDEAYYAKITKLLGSFGGNINNYTATQTKSKDTEIESLKAKIAELEKKPNGTQAAEPQQSEDMKALLARLDKIEESNKALNSELAGFKGKQAQEALKAAVVDRLKSKCDNEEVLNIAMQTYGTLDTKKDADAIAGEVEAKYNTLVKKLYGDGYQPKGSGGGTKPLTTAQAKVAQDAFRQSLIKSGKLPKPATE